MFGNVPSEKGTELIAEIESALCESINLDFGATNRIGAGQKYREAYVEIMTEINAVFTGRVQVNSRQVVADYESFYGASANDCRISSGALAINKKYNMRLNLKMLHNMVASGPWPFAEGLLYVYTPGSSMALLHTCNLYMIQTNPEAYIQSIGLFGGSPGFEFVRTKITAWGIR